MTKFFENGNHEANFPYFVIELHALTWASYFSRSISELDWSNWIATFAVKYKSIFHAAVKSSLTSDNGLERSKEDTRG